MDNENYNENLENNDKSTVEINTVEINTANINTKKQNKFVQWLLKDWKQYRKSQIIALNALLCALVLLFALIPINIGILSLAVIPIIAIIISAEVLGLLNGILTGLFFGFVSFFNHLAKPGLLSPIFIQNPLITFFSRFMIPVVVYFSITLLNYLFGKIKYKSTKAQKITPKILDTLTYAVGGALGVITNTAGVLGFMFLFYGGNTLNTGIAITAKYITSIITTNSVIELAVCTAITPAITLAVKKTLSLTMKKKSLN